MVVALGSTYGNVAATAASAVPVVGAVAAIGIKILDSLKTHPPCDPRSAAVMRQMAALQRAQFNSGSYVPASQALMSHLADQIVRYETECRAATSQPAAMEPLSDVVVTPWYEKWTTYGLAAVGVVAVVAAVKLLK